MYVVLVSFFKKGTPVILCVGMTSHYCINMTKPRNIRISRRDGQGNFCCIYSEFIVDFCIHDCISTFTWAEGASAIFTRCPSVTFYFRFLNRIQQNLKEARIRCPLQSLWGFLGGIGKPRWPPRSLIGLNIFDFSFATRSERNSTKLDRKQDLNVLYQILGFFGPIGKQMAIMTSDCLRHFRIYLCNGWTEFNKTRHEASSQHAVPSLCFRANYYQHVFHSKLRYSGSRLWPFGPLVINS